MEDPQDWICYRISTHEEGLDLQARLAGCTCAHPTQLSTLRIVQEASPGSTLTGESGSDADSVAGSSLASTALTLGSLLRVPRPTSQSPSPPQLSMPQQLGRVSSGQQGTQPCYVQVWYVRMARDFILGS